MGNFISDYMKNWLNTTYAYLKESGGGPTYPPSTTTTTTTGPNVLPIGGYSLVEDVGIDEIPVTQYGTVPLPFNPGATGIPATANSQADANVELAKSNPTPPVLSSNFQRIYGSSMKACIDDQTWGLMGKNPDPSRACNEFAQKGDPSLMLLSPTRQKLIGITISQENDKSSEVQLAENEASLTGQIRAGLDKSVEAWKGFEISAGEVIHLDPPTGNNFQDLNDRLKAIIPGMPSMPNMPTIPDLNSPIILIGGAVVLVVLLIAIVK